MDKTKTDWIAQIIPFLNSKGEYGARPLTIWQCFKPEFATKEDRNELNKALSQLMRDGKVQRSVGLNDSGKDCYFYETTDKRYNKYA